MFVVKCAKCKTKLLKYRKVGKGKLLRCWKDRIVEDYTSKEGSFMKCPKCDEIVGVDAGAFFKMRQGRFTTHGSYE